MFHELLIHLDWDLLLVGSTFLALMLLTFYGLYRMLFPWQLEGRLVQLQSRLKLNYLDIDGFNDKLTGRIGGTFVQVYFSGEGDLVGQGQTVTLQLTLPHLMPFSLWIDKRSDTKATDSRSLVTGDSNFDSTLTVQSNRDIFAYAYLNESRRARLLQLAQQTLLFSMNAHHLTLVVSLQNGIAPIRSALQSAEDLLFEMNASHSSLSLLATYLLANPPDAHFTPCLKQWLETNPSPTERNEVLHRVMESGDPTRSLRAAALRSPEDVVRVVERLLPQASSLGPEVVTLVTESPLMAHLPLLNVWENQAEFRMYALFAKRELKQPVDLSSLLSDYSQLQSITMRLRLLRAFRTSGTRDYAPILCKLLEEPARSLEERVALVEALATCGTPDSLPAVRKCLDPREHGRLQRAARVSIRTITVRASDHVGALSLQELSSPEGQLSLTQQTGGELSEVENAVPGSREKESV